MTCKMYGHLCIEEGKPTVFVHIGLGLTCGMICGDTVSVTVEHIDGKHRYYATSKTGGEKSGRLGPMTLEVHVDGVWSVDDLVPYWTVDDLSAKDLKEMVRKAKEAKKVKQGEDSA